MAKMQFVDATEIPKRKGRQGTNWGEILAQIPDGQAWVLSEKNKDYKLSTVKAGVKDYNENAKEDEPQYEAVQRTVDKVKFLYVSRLAPEAEAEEETEEASDEA